jgi:hypothetical protein
LPQPHILQDLIVVFATALVVVLLLGRLRLPTAVHPSPHDVFAVGDVVSQVGDARQIAAARALLESGPGG